MSSKGAPKKPKAFDEREQLALAKALRAKQKAPPCPACSKAPCECEAEEPDEAEE